MSHYIDELSKAWPSMPEDRKTVLYELDWNEAHAEDKLRYRESIELQKKVQSIVNLLTGTKWERSPEEIMKFIGGNLSIWSSSSFREGLETQSLHPLYNLTLREVGTGFSVRIQNCLAAENIYYVGDLIQWKETELLKSPNLGRRSLNEIKEKLESLGLALGSKVGNWVRPTTR